MKKAAFFLLSLLCMFYAVFAADFAKLKLQPCGFPFPVFIGEICLAVLLVVYLAVFKPWRPPFGRWKIFFGVYFAILLARVVWDYFQYGPLTFRHAALYYYVLFAVFAYHFWDKRFMAGRQYYFWVGLLTGLILLKLRMAYFWFSCFVLAVMLLLKKPKFGLLALFVVLTFLTGGFDRLFGESRTHMVAMWAGFLFMFAALLAIWRAPWALKAAVLTAVFAMMGLGIFKFSDHNSLRSLVLSKEFIDGYHVRRQYVEEHRKSYCPLNLSVRLYNDNLTTPEKALAFAKTNTLSAPDPVPLPPSEMTMSMPHAEVVKVEAVKVEAVKAEAVKAEVVRTEQIALESAAAVPAAASVRVPKLQVPAPVAAPVVKDHKRRAHTAAQPPAAKVSKPMAPEPSRLEPLSVPVPSASSAPEKSPPFIPEESQPNVPMAMGNWRTVELKAAESLAKEPMQESAPVSRRQEFRAMDALHGDQYFRIFIWKDMMDELNQRHKWFSGVGLGLPQRSPSLEIMRWAYSEWLRDGWISPHNSFLHIIYRMGIWGWIYLLVLFGLFFKMAWDFLRQRDWPGLLLLGLILYWLTAANFLLILELPYYAIPFWSLFGLTYRYWRK